MKSRRMSFIRSDPAGEKARLRAALRAAARAMSAQALRRSDEALFSRFLSLEAVTRAKTVLLFYGVSPEPETARLFSALWAMGKAVALPRCLPGRRMEMRLIEPDARFVPGPFGIPEPDGDCPVLPDAALDLALVPALCYDRAGYRLGQGGGYYDRWLAAYSGATMGLCRDVFLQDALPRQGHDRPVTLVLTETTEAGEAFAPPGSRRDPKR